MGWFGLTLLSLLEQLGTDKNRKPYADEDYTAFPEQQQIGDKFPILSYSRDILFNVNMICN